jgi:translation initiation factor 4E
MEENGYCGYARVWRIGEFAIDCQTSFQHKADFRFYLFRLWEDSILSLIGDQFDEEEGIVGMVLSVRGQEDILSVWSDRERDGGAGPDMVDTVR